MLQAIDLSSVPEPECAPVSKVCTPVSKVCTTDGAVAEVRQEDGKEWLSVRAPDGAILFEYDAGSGTGVLRMPAGDLRLEAPAGCIQLVAANGVQCVSGGPIAMQSATRASLTVQSEGQAVSGLEVSRTDAALASDRLHLGAKEARLNVERTVFTGKRLTTTLEAAELVVGKLESRFDTVVERATNVFRYVAELNQLKAGRLRALVKGAWQMKAGTVTVRSEEEVYIDGKQIHLG